MNKIILFGREMFFASVLIVMITINGCNKDVQTVTPALPGNEFLTTVELQLVNTANAADAPLAISTQISPYTGTYQADSVYSNLAFLNLKANSTYTGQVIILDETKTPFDTVSTEILARENYHLFFFQPSPIDSANVVISNATTNIPIADWNTGLPATDTTAGGISDNEILLTTGNPGQPLNLTVTRTDLDNNIPPLQIGLQDQFVTRAASTGILRVVLRHQPNAKNGTYPPGSSDLDVTYSVQIH
jgi:hypothetical protein